MELVLSILAWLAGIIAFTKLVMVIVFAMIAEGEDKGRDIIIFVSSVLILGLLYLGVKSIFFTSYTQVSQTPSIVTSSKKSSIMDEQTTVTSTQEEPQQQYNVGLWIFYIIFYLNFFVFIFTPSKNGNHKKESIKMRLLDSILLKKDVSGLQPWNPNWKPKSD